MDIERYIPFDLPVPYKKLLIHPVTMRDYYSFITYSSCLSLDKNSIPDPKIISMSYLQYLYHLASTDEKSIFPYLGLFDRLLELVLDRDSFEDKEESFEDITKSILRYKYTEKKKPVFYIDGEEYKSEDFDAIRLIIMQQNLIEIPDENISKEVRDSLEKARAYKRKLSGSRPASIEDYIIAMSVSTGWEFEYIYDMTVRKFMKSISRLDNLIHYKIYLQASMSGMVEFKDKSFIKHWLTNLEEENKYKDVSVGLDELQNKVSFESAKQK